jgi:hypothetical protein
MLLVDSGKFDPVEHQFVSGDDVNLPVTAGTTDDLIGDGVGLGAAH